MKQTDEALSSRCSHNHPLARFPKLSWGQRILLVTIRGYQLTLSSILGGQCRFYPTCSHYAQEAVRIHGAWRGASLTLRRLARCHPFHPGGVDLVPESQTQPAGHAAHRIHS